MRTDKIFIISNREILGGKPIIAGTHIAVSTILDLFAANMTLNEILSEYPSLNSEAIQQALMFSITIPNALKTGARYEV